MTPLYIDGQWGLGDNIFARPFVRAAAAKYAVYLGTPWPELYEDLPIWFVRRAGRLRTQLTNIARQPASRWTVPPKATRTVRITYLAADLAAGSIVQSLERQYLALDVKPDPFVFDLPDMGRSRVVSAKPLAIVRPATVRTEWHNVARNPKPAYLDAITRALAPTHMVIALGDLAEGQEWLVPPAPFAHASFLRGELPVRELLALVREADIVTGGVGWIVPATIALKSKAFVVLGGHGGHNAPEKITDPRMDLSRIGFAMPERFCRCTAMLHSCDKTIPNLPQQFFAWASRVGLRCSQDWPSAA